MRELAEAREVSIDAHLWAVLDALPFAIILVAPDRRVLGMNARGQEILREADVLRFDGRFVRSCDQLLYPQLQNAIAAQGPAVLRVRRLSKRRAAEIVIVPLSDGVCALFASDPARQCILDPARLRTLYGVTPAEARVLAAVVSGSGSQAAAGSLGMSVNTLRRHLKSIFAKLDVKRQSELVKIVMSGVATLG